MSAPIPLVKIQVTPESKPPSERGSNVHDHTTNLEEHHIHPFHSSELATILQQQLNVTTKDTTAAIGPLGLFGFGLTTFLLNMENAGVYHMSPVILGMGVCYGGLAQLIAGIMEWKKGNNFTSVAFCSYGTFWWSFVLVHAIPHFGWCEPADSKSLAWYLFVWFLFTLIMLIASFTKPWAIRIIFFLLTLLFLMLACSDWAESPNTKKAAGIIGIIDALVAMYAGAAEILNGAWLRTILPLGAPGEKCFGKIEEE